MGQSDPAPQQNTGSRRMPLTILLAASQLFSIRLPELPAAAGKLTQSINPQIHVYLLGG